MSTRAAVALFIVLHSTLPSVAEGALATARDGKGRHWFGISYNHARPADAQIAAMANCSNYGPSCVLKTTFSQKCFAVVFGRLPDGRSGYELGTGASIPDVERSVMSHCRNRGGNCVLRKSLCDTASYQLPGSPINSPSNPQQNLPSNQPIKPQPNPGPTSGSERPPDGGAACKRYPNLC
jgi:hypothetical protein